MDFFRNTASEFKVRLPRTLYLRGNYEVALVEIQYPHTWQTFNKDDDYTFTCIDVEDNSHSIKMPKGYYKDVSELVEKLNGAYSQYLRYNIIKCQREDEDVDDIETIHRDRIAASFSYGITTIPPNEGNIASSHASSTSVSFHYHKIENKVSLSLRCGLQVKLSNGLSQALGFEQKVYTENAMASYQPDITRGFNTLYVYCSICEPQIVGDTYAPLLRTVFITENRGNTVDTIFDSPHYIPVMQSKFDVIELNIKNDLNELVSFGAGAKVLCKLHFRQKAL
jgi:hypothetical protein